MKTLVTIFLLGNLLTYSCTTGCVKLDLSDTEKTWFDCYSLGDTVAFNEVNNKSKVDSFVVTTKLDEYLDCNRFEISKYQSNRCQIVLTPLRCRTRSSCFVFIEFVQQEEHVDRKFTVYDLRGGHMKNSNEEVYEMIKPNNFSDSLQVRTFEPDISATSLDKEIIQKFKWSKKNGLISYETRYGDKFELKSINDNLHF